MIIGITGTLGAGKGTIANYLVKKQKFHHFSVREFLIEEIKKRKLPINRGSMVLVANDLRKDFGAGYLAYALYEKAAKKGGNSIIESLRTPLEVETLKKNGDFYLFAVDANPKLRYQRNLKRGSETDKQTYKSFLADEKREMVSKDPTKGNIKKCMEMADYKFDNNSTPSHLYSQIEKVLKEIKEKSKIKQEKYKRPSWDDYFMEVTNAIGRRGTCDRGRSGCIVAKDKQILATGYVGSPAGFPHCDEAGHDLRKTIEEDGSISLHCVRTVHAEQNAICQAAKRGTPIDGATVYVKMTPCRTCAMLLINCGIKRVYAEKKYHSGAEELLKKAGIKVEFKYKELEKYPNQKA
jgi:dCMP deaminase